MKSFLITISAIAAAFFVSAIISFIIAHQLGVWDTLTAGIVAAPTVVVVAYLTTKDHKLAAAVITYVLGACVATYLLGRDSYPVSYERAYQPTYIPLLATFASGALALGALFVCKMKKEKGAQSGPRE